MPPLESFLEEQQDPEHYLERAQALRAAGDEHRERALRGLDEGMDRLGPVVALAMSAEVDLGRFDSALARLDRLAAHSPRQETWLAQRGEILEVAQRPEEAHGSYLRVLTEIENLPAKRRRTSAMMQLRSRARAGLARLARSSE